MEDDPKGVPDALWKQLGELGLLGVLIPEEYGGSAQTLLEAVIVFEELGRALAPSPAFESAVMGAGVLLAAGSAAQNVPPGCTPMLTLRLFLRSPRYRRALIIASQLALCAVAWFAAFAVILEFRLTAPVLRRALETVWILLLLRWLLLHRFRLDRGLWRHAGLRDLLRLSHGAPEDSLVNRDRAADLRKVAASIDVKEIRRRTALLEEVAKAIDSNVTPEAAFFSAYARWAKTLPQDAATRATAWPTWN